MARRVDIVVRNPRFGDFADLPKHWAMNNRLTTFSHAIFSIIITEGERFFIRTVNAFKSQIDDPALVREVDLFARQEAMHTRHHVKFNAALRRFGFNVDRIEKNTRRFLRLMEKCLSKRAALAVTVFLEHLTTMLAETGFRFPEFRTEWHRPARNFWTWHGLEEMEHKSVAFDVFRHVGGGYLTRIAVALWMLLVILALPSLLIGAWIRFGRHESTVPATTLAEKLKEHPGLRGSVIKFFLRYLFAYFKPRFHPSNNDSRAHIQLWLNEIVDPLERRV
jgi:predicted metal-dependent hydrolase